MIHEERPWGSFTILQTEPNFQVKKLIVDPGNRLSLQSHKNRAEHWFIVSGEGLAELDGNKFFVHPGNSIDIPIGAKHRIGCSSDEPLVFVEVQTGASFEESDITRYSDDFDRV